MAYPVTLNGRTYTLADFEGQNYVDGLPDAFEDFVTHAGNLYSTTSTSSNSIALGSKTFTVESSKPYQVGTPLRISDAAAETTNWMDGIVTAYSGTTLTVDVVSYAGSGTKTSWNINIGGGAVSYSGTLPITQGGTGATTAAAARTNLDTYSKTEADSRFLNVSGEASDVTMNGNMTFGDSDKAIFGAGSDLQIYHDETSGNSFISESGTSNLKITGENIRLEDASGNRYAQGVAGGASSLYYAGAVKFSTTNAGVDITGDLNLGDNDKAIFGAGSDLQIYHDGDNSYISDEGAGELRLEASSRIRMMGNNGETLALFNEDGAVSLRHNNDPKLATTSTGIEVLNTSDALVLVKTSGTGDADATLRLDSADSGESVVEFLHDGVSGAGIQWFTDGGPDLNIFTTAASGGQIDFQPSEDLAMRIGSDGRVGIGGITPTEALEVDGKIYINAAVPDLMFTDTNTGVDHRISGNSGVGNFTISVDENSEGTDPKLLVKIQDNTLFEIDEDGRARFFNTTTETMRITSSGSVGIGTSSIASDATVHIDGTDTTLLITENSEGTATLRLGDTQGHTSQSFAIEYNTSTEVTNFVLDGTHRAMFSTGGDYIVGPATATTPYTIYNANSDSTKAGVGLRNTGYIAAARYDDFVVQLNRMQSDGDIMQFRKDGSAVGSIGNTGSRIYISNATGDGGFVFVGTGPAPSNGSGGYDDNGQDMGNASARWDDIYATNGTIQTSDANEKQQIAALTDAEMTAAKAISQLFKTFKWNDSVAEKGADAARTHSGVIAQEVEQAMTDAGLDAGDYAFSISTTWWETQTEVPAVEADEESGVEAKEAYTRTDTYDTLQEAPEGATERNRKGIRYPQLLSFVGAATEQRLASIETRLTALEG